MHHFRYIYFSVLLSQPPMSPFLPRWGKGAGMPGPLVCPGGLAREKGAANWEEGEVSKEGR